MEGLSARLASLRVSRLTAGILLVLCFAGGYLFAAWLSGARDRTPLARICSRVDYVKRTVGSYRLAQCTRASLLIVRVPRGVDPKHAHHPLLTEFFRSGSLDPDDPRNAHKEQGVANGAHLSERISNSRRLLPIDLFGLEAQRCL